MIHEVAPEGAADRTARFALGFLCRLICGLRRAECQTGRNKFGNHAHFYSTSI
jgi:hypothetical protein